MPPPSAPADPDSGADADSGVDRYVRTDAVRADLKGRSVRSGVIVFASQGVKIVLGAGATMVLARLLVPADFGLVAMVMPVALLVKALQNFGLQMATVQREQITHHQVSALFWLGLKINLLVVGLFSLTGPVLAWFYGEPRLPSIVLVIAAGMMVLSLAAQHESLLKRQMRFDALALIRIGALLASFIVAVAAAWLGAGYWALVLQLVVVQLTRSAAFWIFCRWRPNRYAWNTLTLDDTLRTMLSYGAYLAAFRFISRIGTHMDRILVGYFSGAAALGLYDVARKWSSFPFKKAYQPLFDVAVASFSRIQHDRDQYRAYCRRGLMPVFTLCMPALAFSVVEARNVLLVLLGDQWLAAVPLFRLLAVAMFVESMFRVTTWLYLAEGRTRRQFRWGLVRMPVTILALLCGVPWGAYGVAAGYTAAACLLTGPGVAYCLKTSPVTPSDFSAAVWRPALASIAAAAGLFAARPALPDFASPVFDVATRLSLFGLTFLLLWVALPGGQQATADVLHTLQGLRLKRTSESAR